MCEHEKTVTQIFENHQVIKNSMDKSKNCDCSMDTVVLPYLFTKNIYPQNGAQIFLFNVIYFSETLI